MRVNLLYFQSVRKLTATPGEPLDLPDGATVADLARALARRYPALEVSFPSLLFAVNEEHANRATTLHDADTVAVMPPFSGG
jgi:molybdopterin converting factor subunit 1